MPTDQKQKSAVFAFLKAAESGDEEAVRRFLNEGGDVHAADDGHNTALHLVDQFMNITISQVTLT